MDAVSGDEEEPEPLVDEEALRAFLEANVQPRSRDPELEVARHTAGKSNETFFVHWDGRDYVLRRPPRGAFLPTAHDVLREYRVLRALEAFPARTPRVVAACDDEDVLGADFYLMERLEGTVLRRDLPDRWGDPEHGTAIGDELVDALAELHTVAWRDTPLADIGYPHGYIERQVDRWADQWERTRERTERVREVPELDQVHGWLEDELPETPRTALVHGDYKLDNVVYHGTPPELVGVLDWEMATLGDPLADLGYLLVFWREADDPPPTLGVEPRFTEQAGFPTRRDLVERYAEATGIEPRNLQWYKTLAVWKLAILLEGSYARFLAGEEDDPFFQEMEEGVPALAERARGITEGEREI
jgi:aminoglycoside phosphotransferase (APT) family kinase protein